MAAQNRCLFFDNLSSISGWLSDALCGVVTGDGFTKRKLYTDDDAIIFEYKGLIGIAGINLVANKPDLLDRSLILELDTIPRHLRRPESAFWADFNRMRPFILGGILDALSKAIQIEGSLEISDLPRMADFALHGAAASKALGKEPEDFLRSYSRNVVSTGIEFVHISGK